MARQKRVVYPGGIYHVMNRGNNGEWIFREDADKEMFLALLIAEIERCGLKLHEWALMDNHFHLLIETPEANLSKAMHRLESSYAQWFNRKYRRTGHLFGERFKSILVEGGGYLMEAARYIVLNPVRACIVAHPRDYKWSSYRAKAGSEDPPPWLTMNGLYHFDRDLEQAKLVPLQHCFCEFAGAACGRDARREEESRWFLGDDEQRSRSAATGTSPSGCGQRTYRNNVEGALGYREFVEAGIATGGEEYLEKVIGKLVHGSAEFIRRVQELIDEEGDQSYEHPRYQRDIGRPPLNAIMAAVCERLGLTEDEVRERRGDLSRMVFAMLGHWEGLRTLREIACKLGLRSYAHVSNLIRRCRRECEHDPTLCRIVEDCRTAARAHAPPLPGALPRPEPPSGLVAQFFASPDNFGLLFREPTPLERPGCVC